MAHQMVKVMLQVNEGDDSNPRWRIHHTSVITHDTTPEMVSDMLEHLERRLTIVLDSDNGRNS